MTAVDFCAGTDEASALEAGHMVTMPPKAERVLIAKKRILKTVGRIYLTAHAQLSATVIVWPLTSAQG